jgi:hypothetical protein
MLETVRTSQTVSLSSERFNNLSFKKPSAIWGAEQARMKSQMPNTAKLKNMGIARFMMFIPGATWLLKARF